MSCFSLGVICENLDEVNDLVYPFHNDFIGYYPKEYFDINLKEKNNLEFNVYSREIETEWEELNDKQKKKFKDIERYADVNYGYYYNDEKSDIGYYTNKSGKMICFSVAGKFTGMLKVKGSLGMKKSVDYAKIKDLVMPNRKENFATYALIKDGKWHSVDDYESREEWFSVHYKRLVKKADPEKYLVIVECRY